MAKWDCYSVSGFFVGIVEADDEAQARVKAVEEFQIKPGGWVDKREEVRSWRKLKSLPDSKS